MVLENIKKQNLWNLSYLRTILRTRHPIAHLDFLQNFRITFIHDK